ncbi:MAG: hypothetical protein JXA89_19300 [Anaerolineae bacterium]|nr:hypothetical protein [Anaerolineae bacterium]
MSKGSSGRSSTVGSVIWGVILIGVGGWFLLDAIGISLPGIDTFWPVFPVLVGCAFVFGWLTSSDKRSAHGIMIPATINILVGLFFFGFTFGFFEWGDMAYLWPVFPLIVGISFLVAWVFSFFREWGLLIPAGVTGAVGVIGLAFTLDKLDNVYLNLLIKGWPVLLILMGLGTLLRGLFGRTTTRSSGNEPVWTEDSQVQVNDQATLEDYEGERASEKEVEVQAFKYEALQDQADK